MEYSKDIILGVNYLGGQASKEKEGRFVKLIKKHKLLATISIICGILILKKWGSINVWNSRI